MADRTTALEAWLGTVVEKGALHKLRDGGPAAVSIVGKAARAIVEEDGGHASPKACAPGGEWGQAKQLARKFSEAAYERWPITTNPTGAEATAAVEILLYCAACCDKSSKRGAYIQRILRLPQAQQQQLMGAMKAQMAAEREAQSGQRKPLDAANRKTSPGAKRLSCAQASRSPRAPESAGAYAASARALDVDVDGGARGGVEGARERTARHPHRPRAPPRRGPRRGARGLRPRQGRGARRPRGAGRAEARLRRRSEAERDAERERALQAEVRALDQSKRRDAEEGQTTQQAKSEIQAAEKRARGAEARADAAEARTRKRRPTSSTCCGRAPRPARPPSGD